jgi:hypothetical protein
MNFTSLDDILDFGGNAVTSVIKTPLEIAFNYSLFADSAIADFKGQKEEFLFMNLNSKLVYGLKALSVPNTINSLVGGSQNMRDVPLSSRVANFVVGRTYGLNKTTQMERYNYSVGRQISALNRDAKQALGRGDVERYKEILKEIRDITISK